MSTKPITKWCLKNIPQKDRKKIKKNKPASTGMYPCLSHWVLSNIIHVKAYKWSHAYSNVIFFNIFYKAMYRCSEHAPG